MKITHKRPVPTLQSFVKSIIVLEDTRSRKLPFYADGFPGLVFLETKNPAFLLPKKKKLSRFFLYGQTIKPIELAVTGEFKLVVFQLYPFASKVLFGVNPKKLNDDCFDLQTSGKLNTASSIRKLDAAKGTNAQIKIITGFLKETIADCVKQTDLRLQLAINLIFESNGTTTVKNLTEQLHTTERTLQRQFAEYVGVSPKQFAKIIQFQFSLTKISQDTLRKLTDIVYENGYADQSHFIRDFRKYANESPKVLQNKK